MGGERMSDEDNSGTPRKRVGRRPSNPTNSPEADKTSDMATVLMQGRDGRLALLAFTSSEALLRWNPEGRPVPAAVQRVAAAALQDEASAIVVDVAGPTTFVLEEDDVRALADGFRLVELSGGVAWAKEGEA